jgi:hypothetical protein
MKKAYDMQTIADKYMQKSFVNSPVMRKRGDSVLCRRFLGELGQRSEKIKFCELGTACLNFIGFCHVRYAHTARQPIAPKWASPFLGYVYPPT